MESKHDKWIYQQFARVISLMWRCWKQPQIGETGHIFESNAKKSLSSWLRKKLKK